MKSEQVSSPETDLPVATLAKVETSYRDVLDETYGPRPGSPSRGDSGAKKEADANQSGTGNPAADADAPGAQFLDMLTGDISTESGDDRSGSVDVDKVEISSSPGDVTGVDDKPLKKDGGDAKNPKTESEPISKMLEWMDKNFDVLDADKDGNLTKAEIGAAMLDPKLGKGEGAAYLSTAFRHANDMGAAAAALRSGDKPQPGDAKNAGETKPVDEGTAEKKPVDKRGPVPAPAPGAEETKAEEPKPPSMTRADIKTLKEGLPRLNLKETKDRLAIDSLLEDWQKIDTNRDETITRDELKEALEKTDWSKEQRQRLELLEKRFSEIAKTTDDMVEQHDDGGDGVIPAHKQVPRPKGDGPPPSDSEERDAKLPEYVSQKDMTSYANRGDRLTKDLEKSLDFREKRFAAGGDGQGYTGSCFVLGPAYGMLDKNPGALKDMIKDNKDGTYTVTFPGDKENPVTVTKPTEAERANYASGTETGIIEKAFAKRHIDQLGIGKDFDFSDGKPKVPVQEALRKGGRPDRAMKLLTGSEKVDGKVIQAASDKDLQDFLSGANEENKIVVAASYENPDEKTGLSGHHAYTITGFDAKSGMVELKNPYSVQTGDFPLEPTSADGKPKDGNNDGRFKLPLSEFKKEFMYVYSATVSGKASKK